MKSITRSSFILLCLTISSIIFAQQSHLVSVTSNVFSPKTLEINIGDTVIWKNTQGNHNVNGTTGTFPSNPESFGNDVNSDWTFKHVFTAAGTYDYQCDPHAGFGMVGTIVVGDPTSILAENNAETIVYPTSFTNILNIALLKNGSTGIYNIAVYSITGLIKAKSDLTSGTLSIDTHSWEKGVYFYKISTNSKNIQNGKIIKR